MYVEGDRLLAPNEASPGRYDQATIWLHWVTAVLVVTLWGMAQLSGFLPRGPARHTLWSVHIVLGAILLLVIAGRVFRRATNGHALSPTGHRLLDGLAKTMHLALYILLVAAVLLGVANTWARGWDLFGIISIPAYDPSEAKRALVRAINGWHDLAANSIMVLAGLHALAALFHHYVLRDGVLRRMTGNTPAWVHFRRWAGSRS
jgi:cytochrome b561